MKNLLEHLARETATLKDQSLYKAKSAHAIYE